MNVSTLTGKNTLHKSRRYIPSQNHMAMRRRTPITYWVCTSISIYRCEITHPNTPHMRTLVKFACGSNQLGRNAKLLVELVLGMIPEPMWQEVTSSIFNYPSIKVEYSAPYMRRSCVASTLLAQMALVGGGVLEYITYKILTISLNFWLSWFLDN